MKIPINPYLIINYAISMLSRINIFSEITMGIRGIYGLPILLIVPSFGLVIVAFANYAAHQEISIANLLFWIGLLIIYVPITAILVSNNLSRQERIVLIIILGTTLYLVKVLNSPISFTSYDEFLHWRTVNDIFISGQLFLENPLHPVGSLYPGLEILTSALINLTGLSVFSAGTIIIGVARLLFIVVLYLLFEHMAKSSQIASLAVLLYLGNPQFLFFNAMFAYESLALTIGLFVLFIVYQRLGTKNRRYIGLTILHLLTLVVLVITHHLSSYILMILLLLWVVVAYLLNRKQEYFSIISVGLITFIISLSWLVFIADITISYFSGNLLSILREIIHLIVGEETRRQLFNNLAGYSTPLWEQMISFAAIALTTIVLPFGIIYVWKKQRTNTLTLVFALISLTFPVMLLLKFTEDVATINRIFAFSYIAIAYVLAFGITGLLYSRVSGRLKVIGITTWVSIIFMGGVIIGWAPWGRLPGPYIVAADSRSIEPEGITAAIWAQRLLGANNRVATDRVNGTLMLVYGMQNPVTKFRDGVNISDVIMSSEFGQKEQFLLEQGEPSYIIIDYRLTTELPLLGFYFELAEQNVRAHEYPIDPIALRKFDSIENVNRVFDSGNIVIYDVMVLSNAP